MLSSICPKRRTRERNQNRSCTRKNSRQCIQLRLLLVRSMRRHLISVAFLLSNGAAGFAGTGEEQLPKHLITRPQLPYHTPRGMLPRGCMATLEVDYHSGVVRDAKIQNTTGSVVLDESVIHTLRRWRFAPDTTAHAEVPICFTSSGAVYRLCSPTI